MTTVFKYELNIHDEQKISMPKNAKILSVQIQQDKPCVWALVDTKFVNEERTFFIYGTGHPIDLFGQEKNFLGTIQLSNGSLVFHVFYF